MEERREGERTEDGREGREGRREEENGSVVAQAYDPKYTRGRYKRFRMC